MSDRNTRPRTPRSDKPHLGTLYRRMQTDPPVSKSICAASHPARFDPRGVASTYVGEEAIAVGVCAALGSGDVVFSTHRGHGHALAKGVTPRQLIAELFGRATGCSNGRGGSMHLFAPKSG